MRPSRLVTAVLTEDMKEVPWTTVRMMSITVALSSAYPGWSWDARLICLSWKDKYLAPYGSDDGALQSGASPIGGTATKLRTT